MGGQSVVLIAVGLFTSLVVAVAGVHQYFLEQNPPSVASGLLWRVENALSSAQDIEAEITSVDHGAPGLPVRMTLRVLVGPIPALSVVYTEPAGVAGQILVVQNDLLSHYMPQESLLVVRRWAGVPLAAVGLAGLDVSRLRAAIADGTVTARVVDDIASVSALGESAGISFTREGPALDAASALVSPRRVSEPSILQFTPSLAPDPWARGTYIVEVRDAKTGRLTQVVWVDRGTYFLRKILYYSDDRLTRTIEVERLLINQGLTQDVLTLPRAATTVRG